MDWNEFARPATGCFTGPCRLFSTGALRLGSLPCATLLDGALRLKQTWQAWVQTKAGRTARFAHDDGLSLHLFYSDGKMAAVVWIEPDALRPGNHATERFDNRLRLLGTPARGPKTGRGPAPPPAMA